MANNRCTSQQTYNVSVPKDDLKELVIYNDELSKKDLRVFLILLTELEGWKEPKRGSNNDPMNFRSIDESLIAERLDLKTKEVKKSLKTLYEQGIIESGDSEGSFDGYRFTF